MKQSASNKDVMPLQKSTSPLESSRLASLGSLSAQAVSGREMAGFDIQLEATVSTFLNKLLDHFDLEQLEQTELTSLLTDCGAISDSFDEGDRRDEWRCILTELRRRVARLAGAQLDDAFTAIAARVVSEDDTAAILLPVEGRKLQGIRYGGEVYRWVQSFQPCYRLQAFCLGQSLSQQKLSYLITGSPARYAVWISVRSMAETPARNHLPSNR